MELKDKIKANCVRAAAAVALACLLYYVNGANGVAPLLLLLCLSTTTVFLIGLLLSFNRQLHERVLMRERFVECLGKLTYSKAKGCTSMGAIRAACKGIDNPRLKAAAEKAQRKHRLGGSFLRHFSSLAELSGYAPLSDLRSDPEDIVRSHGFYMESKRAEIEEAAQRYATINMFLSTILPSFLVFAFVGDAILSQGGFDMPAFSVSLLLLLPLAYSVGNALMWRRFSV